MKAESLLIFFSFQQAQDLCDSLFHNDNIMHEADFMCSSLEQKEQTKIIQLLLIYVTVIGGKVILLEVKDQSTRNFVL